MSTEFLAELRDKNSGELLSELHIPCEDPVPSDFDRIVTGSLPGGATVPDGQAWWFQGIVETDANIIVQPEGLLHQRPGDWLDFKNVDESLFEGGGMEPKPNDTGLWIQGIWDICGTPKVGWNRSGDDPTWHDSDELVSAPQAVGDFKNFRPFTRGSQVPSVTDKWGTVYPTEILNMSRDCGVRGHPDGRVHVFIHSFKPQRICHCTLQHVGPRKNGAKVVGRWGLHQHHCGDGSRGSLIEDVLIRDCGTHPFVPHASHGITFRDTIGFNCNSDAYWWDLVQDDPNTASNDILMERVVGAKIDWLGIKPPDIAGWFASGGKNLKIKDSVMVGVIGQAGSSDPAGYSWATGQGASWRFENNVAHNCNAYGTWLYQNPEGSPPPFTDLVTYRCGKTGISHGAYQNNFCYEDAVSFDSQIGLDLKAVASVQGMDKALRFIRGRFHGTRYALRITEHQREHRNMIGYLIDCDLRSDSDKLILIYEDKKPGWYRFLRCTSGDRDIEPTDVVVQHAFPEAKHEFQRRDGTAFEILPDGTSRDIPAFA